MMPSSIPFRFRTRTLSVVVVGVFAALTVSTLGFALAEAIVPEGPLPLTKAKPADFDGLHNVIRVSEKVYSGGVPEGDAGFQALKMFGIRTIVTVDGAKPEVARAKALRMRYVHLPFGYDSCPVPTANAIAKAVKDLPGPIYIHCHHGKNRSPAAAAIASKAVVRIGDDEAVGILERAGAGKNYTGLFADVRAYKPPTTAQLDGLKVTFPEVTEPRKLVQEMIDIEERSGRLLKAQKHGWKAAAGVDLKYEALQLQELYTELNRSELTRKRPAVYRKWMLDSEVAAKAVEAALRAGKAEEATAAFANVMATCGSCHAKYRNVPQKSS